MKTSLQSALGPDPLPWLETGDGEQGAGLLLRELPSLSCPQVAKLQLEPEQAQS